MTGGIGETERRHRTPDSVLRVVARTRFAGRNELVRVIRVVSVHAAIRRDAENDVFRLLALFQVTKSIGPVALRLTLTAFSLRVM